MAHAAGIVNNSAWTAAGDAVACLTPMSVRRNNRILHIDGDSFFASCEIALDPKLEGRPVSGLRWCRNQSVAKPSQSWLPLV